MLKHKAILAGLTLAATAAVSQAQVPVRRTVNPFTLTAAPAAAPVLVVNPVLIPATPLPASGNAPPIRGGTIPGPTSAPPPAPATSGGSPPPPPAPVTGY